MSLANPTVMPQTLSPAEPKRRPKLRGFSHSIAFFGALAIGVVLAQSPLHGAPRIGATVYSVCIALLFGCSGLYHFPDWPHSTLRVLRRLDHANIFWMIAGSYTAYWTLAPPELHSVAQLCIIWGAAVTGALSFAIFTEVPRQLRAAAYVVLGLAACPLVFNLPAVLGWPRVGLLIGSSGVYILGAVVYARRWPNPNPKWFGYHEVFHLFVIVAASIQFAVLFDAHHAMAALGH